MAIVKRIKYWFTTKEKCAIFDDNGKHISTIKVPVGENRVVVKINGKKRAYNVLRDKATKVRVKKIIDDEDYYFYNINDPMPQSIKKEVTPVIDSETYNIMLEAEVIKKLNSLTSKGLFGNLNPTVVVTVLIIIVVGYYLFSGGSLGGGGVP